MPEHTVQQGDCISSIAEEHGVFWEKIWNHSGNASLKEKRKDPNVLLPGDVVFVPEKESREESGATDQKHRFRKKGVPAKLRLKIMEGPPEPEPPPRSSPSGPARRDKNVSGEDPRAEPRSSEDRPRKNVPYVADIDGRLTEGRTDSEGMIELYIPPGARRGRLILEPGTLQEKVIPLQLGSLNPLSETSGIKQRLTNLGFDCGDQTEEVTPEMRGVLRSFQEKHGLSATGEADQATRDKLKELHGS
jgi:hypothetical protein